MYTIDKNKSEDVIVNVPLRSGRKNTYFVSSLFQVMPADVVSL